MFEISSFDYSSPQIARCFLGAQKLKSCSVSLIAAVVVYTRSQDAELLMAHSSACEYDGFEIQKYKELYEYPEAYLNGMNKTRIVDIFGRLKRS